MTAASDADASRHAKAYAAEAERRAIEDKPFASSTHAARIAHVCVVGAGHMGVGIATALLDAGLTATIVETDATRIAPALARIRGNWASRAKRGQLTEQDIDERMGRIRGVASLADAAACDLFIEAVWESMELKKQVFGDLSRIARENAVLATNTSTLDIDAIAAASGRPQDVIGLHFFNPAHIMRLLEIVRGARTSDHTIAAAYQLALKLGKAPVLVGNCYGFVGNRIFAARDRENTAMLLEGAAPAEIDAAMTAFGFPMGPFALQDMAGGIELTWRLRQAAGEIDPIGDALYAAGRLGGQVGKGYYRYAAGDRTPHPDPEVDAIIAEARARAGLAPRPLSQAEITDRMILPMINEAAKILEEGIARRPSDIDVVWNTGFGWPLEKGGVTYFADRCGIPQIVARLRELQAACGDHFAPASLLERMAGDGRGFADLQQHGR